ncbi:hypothetical protein BH09PAT2_BH09PAT2_05110 [soil metagenome]
MQLPKELTTITPLSRRVALITMILLPISTFFIGMKYQQTVHNAHVSNIDIQQRAPSPTSSVAMQDTLESKTATTNKLLQSNNIYEVVKGLAATHIPETSIPANIEPGYTSFNLPFYRATLSPQQYEDLKGYFVVTEFPSSQELTLQNNTWKAFSYSEASDIYTKNGYACILTNPNRFNLPLTFNCSNIGELKNNTVDNVSLFMRNTFSEAGIDCNIQTCQIVSQNDTIPLPRYSVSLLHFDKNIVSDQEQSPKVKKEIVEISTFLKANDWISNIEDYTETERKWTKNLLISERVIAKNDFFSCVYTITIAGEYGKRQMVECSYNPEAMQKHQEEIDEALH